MNETETARPAAAGGALGGAVAKGSAWLMVTSVVTKGLTLVTHVVMGWLLSKSEIGVYSIALSVAALAMALRDAGARQLLISRQSEYGSLLGPVWGIALATNLIAMLLILVAAPLSGMVYQNAEVGWSVAVIALSIPLGTPAGVLSARLNVEMRFRELAMIQSVSAIVRSLGAIALAAGGVGPMSLVIPMVLVAIVEWVMTARVNPERPWRLPMERSRWGGLLGSVGWLLAISVGTAVINLGNYGAVGLVVDERVVGVYFYAFLIVMQVAVVVTANIGQVLLPAFSGMAGDVERQGRAARRLLRQMMMVGTPLALGLVATFEPLERVLWRGKWDEAIPAVIAVAIFYPLSLVHAVPSSAAMAWQRYRFLAIAMGVQGVGMIAAGMGAAWIWGTPTAISGATGVYMGLSTVALTVVTLRRIRVGAREILADVLPAWVLGLIAAGVGWVAMRESGAALARAEISSGVMFEAVRFVSGGAAFAAVYGVLVRVVWPAGMSEGLVVVPRRFAGPMRRVLRLP